MPKLNLGYVSDEKYAKYLPVHIYQLLTKNPNSFCNIFLLSADISQACIDNINKLHKKFDNFELNVIKMDESIFSNPPNGKPVKSWKGSFVVYYRFFFEKLLPAIDRIILLDIDTMVYNEIQSVFDSDLGFTKCNNTLTQQNIIAGVKTISSPAFYYVNKYLPEIPEYYEKMYDVNYSINAGFILLDLSVMRKLDLGTDYLMKVREEFNDKLISPEQDVFNSVFKDRIKFLSRSYNFIYSAKLEPGITRELLRNQIVVHSFEPKPWDSWKFDLIHKDYASLMRETAAVLSGAYHSDVVTVRQRKAQKILGYSLPLFQLPVAARRSWCFRARLANLAKLLPAAIYRWLFLRQYKKLGVIENLSDFKNSSFLLD